MSLTLHLTKHLIDLLREHWIVVWYDREDAFKDFAAAFGAPACRVAMTTDSTLLPRWKAEFAYGNQTLYTAVNKYVEPKITEVEHAAGRIERELGTASGREATQLRDHLNGARSDYDWAHLAYALGPKRIKDVCRNDRSIAIAHGLKVLCEVDPPQRKARASRKVRHRRSE